MNIFYLIYIIDIKFGAYLQLILEKKTINEKATHLSLRTRPKTTNEKKIDVHAHANLCTANKI